MVFVKNLSHCLSQFFGEFGEEMKTSPILPEQSRRQKIFGAILNQVQDDDLSKGGCYISM